MKEERRIRVNTAVKILAYILMLAAFLTAVFSAIIAAINISGEWYSKAHKAVIKDIYAETAFYAADYINEYMSYYTAPYSGEAGEDASDSEVFDEETEKEQFGYSVYAVNGTEEGSRGALLRQVNETLRDSVDVYKVNVSYANYVIEIYIGDIASGEAPDEVLSTYEFYSKVYRYRNGAVASGIGSLAFAIFIFIFLVAAAGKKEKKSQLVRYIPADLLAAAAAAGVFLTISKSVSFMQYFDNYDAYIAGIALMVVLVVSICLLFFMAMACKIRMGRWWDTSLIFLVLSLIQKGLKAVVGKTIYIIKGIPIVWKTAVFLGICFFLSFLLMVSAANGGYVSGWWILYAAAVSAVVLYTARGMKRLKEGGERLAEGDMDYQIDKDGLVFDLAEHADALNSIAKGMSEIVEEKMKSERFKTELITNVSHDINTPLTSIINYVDFLKRENTENEKIKEYVEVLDRQSKRLKRLTEDIVEASKAATGNVKMNMEPCKVGVLMTQIMGEYQEKAEEKGLKLIMKISDDDAEILADGQKMWRVLNNLLNNICKYSQPGTRVYQSLEEKDESVFIIYKNTSAQELNIEGRELTERFVQGDISRHSEGSGLGLSIAKDLVELQGGRFEIHIDGDLFKVIMEFNII